MSTMVPIATRRTVTALVALVAAFASTSSTREVGAQGQRPMTFLDMRLMKTVGSPTTSPDGQWLIYTLSTPDWKTAKSQSDLYLVSMRQGVASTRRMTFTTDKDETAPRWARDGRSFFFLSNREAPESASSRNQIYVMRPDGGEAQRLTNATEGVREYEPSRDGRWVVYRAGKDGEEQLYRLPASASEMPAPETLTAHPTGVGTWRMTRDGRRVYFVAPDAIDADEKARREKQFTVNIRNPERPSTTIWALDLDPRGTKKLTDGSAYAAEAPVVSDDGKWVAFRGQSLNRYERGITQAGLYTDLYLLDTTTGAIERLTNNQEVGEGAISFSPDSQWVAFSAPDDLTRYTMTNSRVYLRAPGARDAPFRKLGQSFDGDVSIAFWAADAATIFFNEGIRATSQLMALDVRSNAVRQVTNERASLSVNVDDDSRAVLISYADARTPPTLFTADDIAKVSSRAAWRQLTDANPQARDLALGDEEEVTWKSTDGSMVAGVVTRPVGYQPGRRYPLIVAIHGGPAAADVLSFNGGYGSQVYAGAGYVVLKPNYRGSTNYGLKHKTDIVGNYFQRGYEDIMTGVDHLIAEGLVDGARMGVLGWSAGGHWSNWILTHTDRFKAISSGAGTSNWISMYAQSDIQRTRQYYIGDKLPYHDFDAYWNQSPLKYITNAKTPTMIHVVEGDPRVPSPQSIELHMALKQLGVDTELYMYPGTTHGITDPRNQLVKSVSEMAWMDYYVRGVGSKFSWRDVLKTLDEPPAAAPQAGDVRPGIEMFLANLPAAVRGKRIGLITNHSGIDRNRRSDIDLIAAHPDLKLVALLAPEHGIRGEAQAGVRIDDETDPKTGVPVYSLYKAEDRGPSPEMLANVDAIVYDLQEVGGRTWTYVSTMALSMQAAARKKIPFVVLDRPNPIGGEIVEGALLEPKFASFVGMYPIPARHGMTVGELATLFNQRHGIGADLIVIRAANWRRSQWLDDTGLPWINPSPNLRSLAAVTHYPGSVYFEGTNIAEGRGTDRPFEQVGAPWLNASEVARLMNARNLPGVRFEAITMPVEKTAGKYPGQTIPAVRYVITDRQTYRPVRASLLLIDTIRRQHPTDFAWRASIDRLTGSDKVRLAIDGGRLVPLLDDWDRQAAAFTESRRPYLLY
jgi:uncharacterized protein YbbC (DUF1343 family)/dipeptidyl aminopeptidase/acylaminoacyl peptidase